jgi:membrane associated rhomboid family serine protease
VEEHRVEPVSAAPRAPRPGDDPRAWWEAFGGVGPVPEHGWFERGRPAPTTREGLAERCRKGAVPPLVWTPESGGLTYPWEVPYLFAAIRARAGADARRRMILPAAVGAVLLSNVVAAGSLSFGSSGLVYLFLCGVWLAAMVAAWLRARALTPAALTAQAERLRTAPRPALAEAAAKSVFSQAMAALFIGVGLAQLAAFDTSLQAAALVKDAVRHGQVWRMLTAALLHGGLVHFFFNFVTFGVLSLAVERHAHRYWVPIVFVVSAVAASAASLVALPNATSLGASGGLLGLFGFLAVMAWRRKEVMPEGFSRQILMDLALIAGMGVVGYRFIDNAAHAGGLVSGALIGLLAVPTVARAPVWAPGRLERVAGYAALALFAAAAAADVFLTLRGFF